MKSYLTGLMVAVAAGSLQTASAGDLSGSVKLEGTPPAEKTIDFSGPNEATCGKLHPNPVTTRHYVVGSDKGLANVFVYVKEGATKSAAKGDAPVLDQVGCMYQPYVMGAMAGQDIAIRNSDPFMHNVHAMPKVSGNEGFNLAQVVKGQTNKKKFNNQEVLLRVQCDVHPWMFAYIGVTDNPYYAVTDKDGKFTIKDLPPGKYTLEAVHPKAGKKSQQITVEGSPKPVDFTLSVPAPQ
ncbi:MAG TPA: carboxypeptidase regulatory-like domain-containing protein [Candidatus Saccharimonadales bacterium]|nr:carboxypeptidase regulatory-like domain-containing protein [Candidatus Saccharimonadales bacterium]